MIYGGIGGVIGLILVVINFVGVFKSHDLNSFRGVALRHLIFGLITCIGWGVFIMGFILYILHVCTT